MHCVTVTRHVWIAGYDQGTLLVVSGARVDTGFRVMKML